MCISALPQHHPSLLLAVERDRKRTPSLSTYPVPGIVKLLSMYCLIWQSQKFHAIALQRLSKKEILVDGIASWSLISWAFCPYSVCWTKFCGYNFSSCFKKQSPQCQLSLLCSSWPCSLLLVISLLTPLREGCFLVLILLSIGRFFSTFPHDSKLLFSKCSKRSLSLAPPHMPRWILKGLSLNTSHDVSLLLWLKSWRNGNFSPPPTPQFPTSSSPVLHHRLLICWIFHVWLLQHLTTRPGTCFSIDFFKPGTIMGKFGVRGELQWELLPSTVSICN